MPSTASPKRTAGTNTLWTAVNERDNIGDNLVPDYVTSVREGGFYGWPVVPDLAVGAHTASLGLVFYTGTEFPERYRGGMFVGHHGSWNRTEYSGYKVAFIPFRNGRLVQPVEDFLTNPGTGETYGRPVGVAADRDGAFLVADNIRGISCGASAPAGDESER